MKFFCSAFVISSSSFVITARKRSLRRLCFYRCLSVHGGVHDRCPTHVRYTPSRYYPQGRYTLTQVHPTGRYTHQQVHPPGRYTPPGTPSRQVHPQAGPHPQQVHPPQISTCWEIRATSGWDASYWNAFLLDKRFLEDTGLLCGATFTTVSDLR